MDNQTKKFSLAAVLHVILHDCWQNDASVARHSILSVAALLLRQGSTQAEREHGLLRWQVGWRWHLRLLLQHRQRSEEVRQGRDKGQCSARSNLGALQRKQSSKNPRLLWKWAGGWVQVSFGFFSQNSLNLYAYWYFGVVYHVYSICIYIAKSCWILWFECSVHVNGGFPKKSLDGRWVDGVSSIYPSLFLIFLTLPSPLHCRRESMVMAECGGVNILRHLCIKIVYQTIVHAWWCSRFLMVVLSERTKTVFICHRKLLP